MEIVSTTFLALALTAVLLLVGPRRGQVVLACALPAGAASAFNLPALGNASILMTDVIVVAAAALLLLQPNNFNRVLMTMKPFEPGFFLIVTLAIATVITAFSPRLFAGSVDVFGVVRIDGITGIIMRPLRPTGANVTQLFRFALGVMAFLVFATVMRRRPDTSVVIVALACATGVHAVLGALDVATHMTGTRELMEPIRTANYALAVNHELAGVKRMVGGFPEASAFGYLTLGLFGFWLYYVFAGGAWRAAPLFLLATTVVLAWSASSSAYVAAGVLMAILGTTALVRLVASRRNARQPVLTMWAVMVATLIGPVTLFALVILYQTQPAFSSFFDRLLFDKLQTDSGIERMSWNVQAFRNFLDTNMLGAGMGSVRASNWVVANLASIGLAGTVVFFMFLGSLWKVHSKSGDRERDLMVTALKAGCLGLLVRACIIKATPNLEVVFFLIAGLAVGLARASAVQVSRAP